MVISTVRARSRRVIGFLAENRAAIWVFTIANVLLGLIVVQTDYVLNDEGLLIHYFASWARQDFWPVFFFQKAKPVLCVLYLPATALDLHVTLIVHVLVASLSIPLIAATARSLGYRLPNLPALVLALSPLYFYGSPAGWSNVDGIVGIVFALYLLCARRLPFAAGVVIGLLPWVRFELGTFCAVMAAYALVTQGERKMLLGMAVFPLAYIAAGALYHRDAFWIVHFPGAAPADPENPLWSTQSIGLQYLFKPLVAVTPAVAIAVLLPVRRLRRVERALLIYTVLTAIVMNVLPMFQIGDFGSSPRYSLHLLPALALLVGRAVEPWWDGERPSIPALLVAALIAIWIATRQQDGHSAEMLIGGYALILTAAGIRAGTLATGFAIVLFVSGPLLPLRTDVVAPQYLNAIFMWLKNRPEWSGKPIYTNAHLLAPFLKRRLPGVEVYDLASPQTLHELQAMTNAENGQRDRIFRLCAVDLYGKTLFPPVTPEDLPADALLALREDLRVPLILPPAVWSPRVEMLVDTPTYRIGRLRPGMAAAHP
jgi:hypothetical protein